MIIYTAAEETGIRHAALGQECTLAGGWADVYCLVCKGAVIIPGKLYKDFT